MEKGMKITLLQTEVKRNNIEANILHADEAVRMYCHLTLYRGHRCNPLRVLHSTYY